MKVTVVLEKQPEGGYTVYTPSIKGCISQGETREEALANIKEALELFLEAEPSEIVVENSEITSIIV